MVAVRVRGILARSSISRKGYNSGWFTQRRYDTREAHAKHVLLSLSKGRKGAKILNARTQK